MVSCLVVVGCDSAVEPDPASPSSQNPEDPVPEGSDESDSFVRVKDGPDDAIVYENETSRGFRLTNYFESSSSMTFSAWSEPPLLTPNITRNHVLLLTPNAQGESQVFVKAMDFGRWSREVTINQSRHNGLRGIPDVW